MPKLRKTKVFIDAFPISTEKMSGIGHVLLNLVKQLDSDNDFFKDYEVYLTASGGAVKAIERRWVFKNIKFKKIPIKGKIFNGLNVYGLMPPVDLFLGSGIYLFINYTTWPLLCSKSITYIHDLSYMLFPETVKPKVLATQNSNVQKWAKRSSVVVTASTSAKNDIIKLLGVSEDKIKIVPHGVDLKVFSRQDKKAIEAVVHKYGLPQKYVLFVSSIEPRKNIETLIDAYVSLPQTMRNEYGLVLVGGDGWLNEKVLDKIDLAQKAGENIIRPNKYVTDEDLPTVISGATVLVHPALYEGFGLGPLQAMACGTPVVVANNSSLPEIVGRAGMYFETLNSEELSRQLFKIIKSPQLQKEFGISGRSQAKHYTWQNSVNKLKKVINDLNQ